VCLIIASIVLLITVYRLTVASLVDCEGAKARRNFLTAYPENVSGHVVAILRRVSEREAQRLRVYLATSCDAGLPQLFCSSSFPPVM
jgi:hypothetical protein